MGGGGGVCCFFFFFFFKQKTAYEIGMGDWSSDVCCSDLVSRVGDVVTRRGGRLCMPVIDWDSGTMHAGEVHTLHVGTAGGPVEGRHGTPIAPEGAEVIPAWDIGVGLGPGVAFDVRGGRAGGLWGCAAAHGFAVGLAAPFFFDPLHHPQATPRRPTPR